MAELRREKFPRTVDRNEVRFTVNLRAARLFDLMPPGGSICARDENAQEGEDAQANVRRVWEAVGEVPPNTFVSIAVRVGENGSSVSSTLQSYGSVVLEIFPRVIAADAVIFNGDVKNLGYNAYLRNDISLVSRVPFNGDIPTLASLLRQFINNQRPPGRSPRLLGTYFEARLRRALIADDVCQVWVDPADSEALKVAQAFCDSTQRPRSVPADSPASAPAMGATQKQEDNSGVARAQSEGPRGS